MRYLKDVITFYRAMKIKKHKAVFIDRDGTINTYTPDSYTWKIEDFEWLPEAKEALRTLSKTDYKIVVVSNQSGIGKGKYTEEDVNILHAWMLEECKKEDIRIDAIYICPHHSDEGCVCRKPNPGMMRRAAEELNINLKKSWMIGDNPTDIEAGRRAGVKTIKIKNEKLKKEKNVEAEPHKHKENLKEGIEHILQNSHKILILKALALLAIVAILVALWQREVITKEGIFSFLKYHPNLAPLLFIVISAFGIALLLPIAIVMGLGAGFFWGTWIGGLYTFVGLVLGSALGFWISRYMAGEAVRRYINIRIWKRIEEEAFIKPWRAVLMVRLCQMVPLGVGTYMFGVTRVPFWKFFGGTSLILLPNAFLFSAIGESIGGFIFEGTIKNMVEKGTLALFGICVLVVGGYIVKKRSSKS